MPDICFGFEVHQPLRVKRDFREELARGKRVEELFDIYFDNEQNKSILERVAKRCYIPANEIILQNIDRFKKERRKFKIAYSISGVLIEQCERWAPEVLDSFKKLADSGCVEFLGQTYFHSLSSLFSAQREEFVEQVTNHNRLMRDLFGCKPAVFENTEFIYNNSIAKTLERMGYFGVFTEGAERILGWRSPNYVYKAKDAGIAVLLRNYRLSDDIAFRFSAGDWPGWPLTADKYVAWLSATPGQCINIFVDYETFGEHQWPETGIFEFLKWLPGEILKHENLQFKTPSEVISSHAPVGDIDVHDFNTISWADVERSTNAWLGNHMQRTCYEAIKKVGPYVRRTGDEKIIKLWRLLQMSDHIYYMYTEPGASGVVHGYFSQQFPTNAFWTFTRILSNFHERVIEGLSDPERTSARLHRVFPPDRAFHFHENGDYINLSAHSLDEFLEAVKLASERSIRFHAACNHFEKWVRYTIGDQELANEIARIDFGAKNLKQTIYNIIERRLSEIKP